VGRKERRKEFDDDGIDDIAVFFGDDIAGVMIMMRKIIKNIMILAMLKK